MEEKDIIKKQNKEDSLVGKIEEAAAIMSEIDTDAFLSELGKLLEDDQ